jgi:hypothetical protein
MDKCVMDKVLLTSQAATMLVCLVAIITLTLTARNTRANAKAQKARFLLDLRNTFMDKHKPAADKLWDATYQATNAIQEAVQKAKTSKVVGTSSSASNQDIEKGEGSLGAGQVHTNFAAADKLKNVELDSDLSLYMGTLELCEVMLEDGLFDISTFYDAHGYRVEQLVKQAAIMDAVLPKLDDGRYGVDEYWPKFVKLLWRVHMERIRRGKDGLEIGGVAAHRRIPNLKFFRPATSSWWWCW